MKKFNTHIIMVSGQMVPNVTPVLDETIRPERVILCASNRMLEQADTLTAFFKAKKIEAEVFPLGSAYDFSELQDRFLELAARFEDTASVAVNLTGGTKLMTIAAQLVFDEFPRFYVIPEQDLAVMVDAQHPETYAIQDRILLRDYFAIHGYSVNEQQRKKKIPEKTGALADALLKNYDTYKNQLGVLNALAAKAEDAYSLSVRNEISDSTCELLNLFYGHGSISYYDDKKIEFASKESRSFCKGFWLEDFICGELAKVDAEIGLQDWAASIEIESASGTRNEIDAAFLHNNELYVIECKTARMDQKGSDVLYKLDTIRGYAGLYTKSIVATFKDLEAHDRRRAEDLKITLVEGRNLNRFAERILALLPPANGDNR
uniref:Card1-like endonuclease domain-containing protein n=1 Tax=Pontiella sp. TaxID=2837462 RepID=UPI00356171A9